MQRDVNKNIDSHPSSEELAKFVDKKLDEVRRAEITKHLIACDECSDVVALVMKYGGEIATEKKTPVISESKKERKYVNNINYKGLGVALVVSVASVLLFIVMMPEKDKSFIEFYTYNQHTTFNAPVKVAKIKDIEAKNKEINEFLNKLIKSVNMTYLKEFNQAEEELKKGNFDTARELYQVAMNIVEEEELDKKEKDKKCMVITYKILLLSITEGDNESINEYKDVLKDNVRRFRKRWLQPRK